MLELSGSCPCGRASFLWLAAGPTTPCRSSDVTPQGQLLFRVGLVLLLFALLYLVPRVDDLFFFNIPPLLNNKIIFRTNREMKQIINV